MIIHGLYGSGKELAEKSTDSWTQTYLRSFAPGSRLMLFEWESQNIFAGFETYSVVGALSRRLLQDLVDVGGENSMVCILKTSVVAIKLTKESSETIRHVRG